MVAAIAARTGAATVVERMTTVHIDVTGAEPSITGGGSGGTITGNTLANPTVVTSAAHGLQTGDTILIAGSNSTPTINGNRVVTVTGGNTFTVPVNVTVAGTAGTWTFVTDSQGRAMGAERRYYILVDAPAGTLDAKSVIFAPSADGKFTWDDYIFPEDGAYTLRLRDAADDSDQATASVTVTT
jgi:hypothetical protein